MCCTRLAENTGRKNLTKIRLPHTIAQLRGAIYIFATKAYSDNRKKILLNTTLLHTLSRNMVNFGPLAAETGWRVWGIPANFNGFHYCTDVAQRRSTKLCSNEANTRKPLKFAAVPQTGKPISAANGPKSKFTIL